MFSYKIDKETYSFRELIGCAVGDSISDYTIYRKCRICALLNRNVLIDNDQSVYSYQSNTRTMYLYLFSLYQRNNSCAPTSYVVSVDFDQEIFGYTTCNETRLLQINKFVAIKFKYYYSTVITANNSTHQKTAAYNLSSPLRSKL